MKELGGVIMKKHRNPAVTVDAIIEHKEGIVLVRRGKDPYKDMWALPGGHVEYGESLETAVAREIFEETGLELFDFFQFKAYSEPGRDPRGHYVSMVYYGKAKGDLNAGDDACDVKVYNLEQLPPLAFDHQGMINDYLAWKNGKT